MLLQLLEPGQTPEPHASERKVAIGIDLGTTHSVAAMSIDGRPVAMRLGDRSALIPSAVSYGEITRVGHEAMGQSNVLTSTKRLMGRGADDAVISHFPQVVPSDSNLVQLQAHSEKTVTPVEVSAEILRYIREQAEAILEEPVEQAVITVPAYFDDAARAATKDAARLAGLQVLRLINEPTAAALAYGLDNNVEGLYAVYDLGGGTFDISLLKLEKGVFQVLATGGDLTLGGDDVDRALCTCLDVDPTPDNLRAIRTAKESLSEEEKISVPVGEQAFILTRQILQDACAPLIERTLTISQNVLTDAGVTAEQVEGVVLVGGSTRLNSVMQAVEDFFGKPPLLDINPDEAVALGAAAQAHGLTEGSDNLLLDVIPLSLGIETMGEIVEKILHRNSPIPAQAKQEFTTYQDGQTGLVIHVVQGEREFVNDCRSLARFELHNIPPLPAGIARIEIAFNVDADGLLTVSAKELTTGQSQHIEVKPSYGLTQEEMSAMLEASLKHGRGDMEKRLLEETRVEARRLIHDVTIALEKDGELLSQDERTVLRDALAELESLLEQGNRDLIINAHERLDQATQAFAQARMNKNMSENLVGKSMNVLEDIA